MRRLEPQRFPFTAQDPTTDKWLIHNFAVIKHLLEAYHVSGSEDADWDELPISGCSQIGKHA